MLSCLIYANNHYPWFFVTRTLILIYLEDVSPYNTVSNAFGIPGSLIEFSPRESLSEYCSLAEILNLNRVESGESSRLHLSEQLGAL